MLLHDDWALATIIYGWFLAACYPDGSSHEDYLPFERFLAPKSYPAMLNTRKNARSGGYHPVMARNPCAILCNYLTNLCKMAYVRTSRTRCLPRRCVNHPVYSVFDRRLRSRLGSRPFCCGSNMNVVLMSRWTVVFFGERRILPTVYLVCQLKRKRALVIV